MPFVDVAPSEWFFAYVQNLYCDGVISGYSTDPPCREGTPCFRPGDPTTRGQLAKIAVLAFDFPVDTGAGPTFEDVPSGSTFFPYVETAAQLGLVSGYPCGRLGEPCDPYDRPYYRPGGGVTRGQVAKIAVSAAIVASPDLWTLLDPAGNAFEDVPAGSTYFRYVETALAHGILGGYPCGSAPAGDCVPPQNRPYFVPNAGATRAQISKIVYLCLTGPAPR
jgi:hypothetical protein